MKEIIKKSPILPWIIVFVLSCVIFRENGATNEMSRFATLRAMSDSLTFKINEYQDWTVDWSIKDGNIYSNKAPGPMLLSFPLFYVLDQFSKFDKKDIKNSKGFRTKQVTSTPRSIISLVFQVLPFSLLLILIVSWLQKNTKIPHLGIHVFTISILFGNSAAIFMNFFFGHGMVAIFVLGLSFSLIKKEYFGVGLFFGLALLSEYTASLLILPLALVLLLERKNIRKKDLIAIIYGGLFPGILWCFYHYSTVGSIFKIPAQYQNPRWIDKSSDVKKIWGMFALPDLEIFSKLLFGFERGILWTQPWVFLGWISGINIVITKKEWRSLSFFILTSSLLLLIMNSSFNGWHGGATSGPRYLSMMFPAVGLLIVLNWEFFKDSVLRWTLFCSVIFSVLFRILVYGSRALAPEGNDLWPWLFEDLLSKPGYKGEIRALSITTLLLVGLYFVRKKALKSTSC